MEKKPSFDHLLPQIAEIMDMIKHRKGPISQNITPAVLAQLDWIETIVQSIYRVLGETLKENNIEIDHINEKLIEDPNMSPKQKQSLQRACDIDRDARVFQIALTRAEEQKKGERKKRKHHTKGDKEQMKERRKLFKPLGGDKTWIPL